MFGSFPNGSQKPVPKPSGHWLFDEFELQSHPLEWSQLHFSPGTYFPNRKSPMPASAVCAKTTKARAEAVTSRFCRSCGDRVSSFSLVGCEFPMFILEFGMGYRTQWLGSCARSYWWVGVDRQRWTSYAICIGRAERYVVRSFAYVARRTYALPILRFDAVVRLPSSAHTQYEAVPRTRRPTLQPGYS